MTIDGESLPPPVLAESIKQAMIQQGEALINHARQGIEDAAGMAREWIETGKRN